MQKIILVSAAMALGCASSSLQKKIDACNTRLTECTQQQEFYRGKLDDGQEGLDWALARMQAYETIARKLRNAFDTGDLAIVIRGGRMVVQLPNEILFESGKVALSPGGKETLGKVAVVLKTMPKRSFVIAGHTDDIAVRKKHADLESNWDLSVARGLRVLKLLVAEGVNPRQLSAAGYGEFLPTTGNDTDAGRNRNRRVEIIVTPTLSEIPQLPPEI